MVVVLLIIIAAALLFGAAAVRSALASALFFVAVVAAALILVFGASQLSARDWITLIVLGLIMVGLLCGWSVYQADSVEWQRKQSGLHQVWQCYEQRGIFSADDQVRQQAAELLKQGDQESLDRYCSEAYLRLRFEGYLPDQAPFEGECPAKVWPPADSPVRRVWTWHEKAIEGFSPEAQRLARRYFQADDAQGLDRHCRETLASV